MSWVRVRADRHRRALGYAGRLREMESFRWPRVVGEALVDKKGKGSWVDYVKSLRDIYVLSEEWAKECWSEREWRKVARRTVLEVAGREWRGEVESTGDLGSYGEQQQELSRADYLKIFKEGIMLKKKSRSGVSGVVIGSRKRLFVIWFFTFFIFIFTFFIFYFSYFLFFYFFYVMAVIGQMARVGSVQASVCDAEGTGPDGTRHTSSSSSSFVMPLCW